MSKVWISTFQCWPGQRHTRSGNHRAGNADKQAVGGGRLLLLIIAATILGIGIYFSSLDPIKALFWSAVINGFVAVPVMAAMMWVGSRRDQMGRFTVPPVTLTLGWATTAIMAAAAIAMLLF